MNSQQGQYIPNSETRAILRRVAARDRRFFETYPQQSDYARPFVPGEEWPQEVHCRFVMVTRHPSNPQARIVGALGDHTDAVWGQTDYDLLTGEAEQLAYAWLVEITRICDLAAYGPEGEGRWQR